MIEAKKKDHSYRVFRKVNRKANSFPMADDYSFSEQPKDVTVWCSNDYLGMSRNPKVVDAAKYDAFSSPSFHFFYNYMTDYILVRVQWTSGYWSKTTLKTVSVLIVVLFFCGFDLKFNSLFDSFVHSSTFIHSFIDSSTERLSMRTGLEQEEREISQEQVCIMVCSNKHLLTGIKRRLALFLLHVTWPTTRPCTH